MWRGGVKDVEGRGEGCGGEGRRGVNEIKRRKSG